MRRMAPVRQDLDRSSPRGLLPQQVRNPVRRSKHRRLKITTNQVVLITQAGFFRPKRPAGDRCGGKAWFLDFRVGAVIPVGVCCGRPGSLAALYSLERWLHGDGAKSRVCGELLVYGDHTIWGESWVGVAAMCGIGETIRINVKNKPANGAGMLSAAGLSGGASGTEKIKPLSLAPPPVASTKSRTAGTENIKPLSLAPPPSASGKIRSPLPPPPNDPAAVRMTSTSQNASVKGHNDTARRSTDAFTDFSQLEMSISGAGDGDYNQLAIAEYQVEYGAGDDKDEEEDVQEVRQPIGRDIAKKKGEASTTSSTSCNEDALVNEFRSHPNLQG
ncbi:hypothetical protein Tco_1071085 [Tanacetum coccineum]|uniref:Uncharacterized protein n=1 Tax=Tanacetum coccineum TaxID=301880 RepID=A0ABQ5HNH1_9ASTR